MIILINLINYGIVAVIIFIVINKYFIEINEIYIGFIQLFYVFY